VGDKVNVFINKLYIWVTRLEKRNLNPFSLTFEFTEKTIDEKDVVLGTLLESMKTYLRELRIKLFNILLLVTMMLETDGTNPI